MFFLWNKEAAVHQILAVSNCFNAVLIIFQNFFPRDKSRIFFKISFNLWHEMTFRKSLTN